MKMTVFGKPILDGEYPIIVLLLINSFLLGALVGAMLYEAYL